MAVSVVGFLMQEIVGTFGGITLEQLFFTVRVRENRFLNC